MYDFFKLRLERQIDEVGRENVTNIANKIKSLSDKRLEHLNVKYFFDDKVESPELKTA